jgi:hypothetical protein
MLMLLKEICKDPDERCVNTVWAVAGGFSVKADSISLDGLLNMR